jgi:hypothetical protein
MDQVSLTFLQGMSPFLALSGQRVHDAECPLSGGKANIGSTVLAADKIPCSRVEIRCSAKQIPCFVE